MLCHIEPKNVLILQLFCAGMGVMTLIALVFGQAYFRGWVSRQSEPLAYWVTCLSQAFLSLAIATALWVC